MMVKQWSVQSVGYCNQLVGIEYLKNPTMKILTASMLRSMISNTMEVMVAHILIRKRLVRNKH